VDDVDVGKPRLPWTAAGDGVGRATAFVVGRPGGGGGRGRGAAGRRRGGDVGRRRAGGGGQNGGAGAGVERARGERNRKEEERAR
jgi:hypothetical protein